MSIAGCWKGIDLIVWDGIMGCQKTDLVIMKVNLNARVISTMSFVLMWYHFSIAGATFQHDNARPHTWLHGSFWHKITLTFFHGLPYLLIWTQSNTVRMSWVGVSTHCKICKQPALTQEWQALPNALIHQYVKSMRRRIMMVIRHKEVKLVIRQDVGSFTSNFHKQRS